jgi:hypothetical protein
MSHQKIFFSYSSRQSSDRMSAIFRQIADWINFRDSVLGRQVRYQNAAVDVDKDEGEHAPSAC